MDNDPIIAQYFLPEKRFTVKIEAVDSGKHPDPCAHMIRIIKNALDILDETISTELNPFLTEMEQPFPFNGMLTTNEDVTVRITLDNHPTAEK